MDVFDAIKTRRSIRRFKEDPVSEEDLRKILDAARWAPSAGNRQSWEFVIVRDLERKRALARAALGQMFIVEAPVVVVVGANIQRSSSRYGERGATLYCIQDTAAAIMNLMLAAHALGYGTCWVGAFYDEEVAKIVGFPSHVRPVAIIPLGRPAEKPAPTPRLPLEKVVHIEKYGSEWTGG
ncbi:MAG: nitroreductase family protein [Crenarchaeota archaeon]|nr:nitroreductase family protein [Thermoproteota archaeon]MCR8453897.1 nitroreductase family protein [Thermoproteota archaeon]MCR8455276.1 nitroreductase family protein [Thermoproteota archaeon]MCR8463040.1 nitroreductase family protein [Thermoproteota archaeon]MCR8470618.1 nitroreductase family protein [Thermoproteota archaeon]